MSAHPTIVFIRHGETDWNVALRLQGQRDIPLNDRGRAQARRNGAMAAEAVPGIAAYDFVASPLGRARDTMEIARSAMGLDPRAYRLDDRLREITFGDWEGFTTEELRRAHPELVAAREADKWSFLPPNGESYRMLSARAAGWLNSVKGDTVAVSHGGIGRVLIGLLTGMPPADTVALDFPQDRFLLWRDQAVAWV
jgi:probable phosphoglycerate mutase